MNRHILSIITAFFCMVICFFPVKAEQAEIWVASDLHYLAESLNDNGSLFQEIMKKGDGKLTEYSGQIIDELLNRVMQSKPEALILSGDLTFNGEKVSLVDLSSKLRSVEEAGVPVLVLPGNFIDGYIIANQKEISQLLEKYKVKANFSGHSHMWHHSEEEDFTDYAAGSLCVYPLGYEVFQWNDENELHIKREELSEYKNLSLIRFDECSRRLIEAELNGLDIEDEVKEQMITYGMELNRNYFSGEIDSSVMSDQGWNLWKEKAGSSFMWIYMLSMF